jgi:hypothetical protein
MNNNFVLCHKLNSNVVACTYIKFALHLGTIAMGVQSFRFKESLKNEIDVQKSKFLHYNLCTSHKGLLFSAQEAALRVPGLLRATHRSRSFIPPSNESSVFANGTPDPHHAIIPGHPASVADVHHRLPSNFSINVLYMIEHTARIKL